MWPKDSRPRGDRRFSLVMALLGLLGECNALSLSSDARSVVSSALQDWQTVRKARIDELFAAHRSVSGSGSGRRWQTEQLNWALVLKVAGEFQGFSRALHDEAVAYFAQEAGQLNPALTRTLRIELTWARQLDRGNANPSTLGGDFNRLGMQFWPDLRARYASATRWHDTLQAMNESRNAIAHDNQGEVAQLKVKGWPLSQLATIDRFRRAADSTTKAMDTVVGTHLHRMFGGQAPW